MSAGHAGGGGADKRGRLHSPPVELPSSNAKDFFEEAKIGQAEEAELRRKFSKFCTRAPSCDGPDEDDGFLTLDNFCSMLQYYECAGAQHYESYFHAIDRNHDDKLDFGEFFLGCCAADPSTVHILNSFTGYERSLYIFDFYDSDRSASLDFNEFARLTAECLGTHPGEDHAIRAQALEKARELGALEDGAQAASHFVPIRFSQFYEFVQNERLRGTSRLFRFYKSIIKSRASHHGRRAHASSMSGASPLGDDGHGDGAASEEEGLEWHAHLLDMDSFFGPQGAERPAPAAARLAAPPYSALLPPPPAPLARPDPEPPPIADARALARRVLRTLGAPGYDDLVPRDCEAPFTLVSPAQLRSLCGAVARSLELDDVVLSNIQPPVKVFGALHGQLLDLLSHFKWQQAPLEEGGDILYTSYVFLGDYADRGFHSLEVLTLLFSLKVVHPSRVFLLRGHHESRHLNYHLGLRAECERRCGAAEGPKVFEQLNRAFEYLSLAAVVGGQLLALGPSALPPSLTRLDQLRRYRKPLALPHPLQPRAVGPTDRAAEQVLVELFAPGPLLPRGALGPAREAAPEQVRAFCAQHGLAAVVRSRQVPAKGFAFECGGRLITIASCLNYCDGAVCNDAAVLCITQEEGSARLQVRPKTITAQVAKLYSVLGRHGQSFPSVPPRWPVQARAATPGRCAGRAGVADGDAACSDAAALVVSPDHGVSPDASVSLVLYPAFGPGRLPTSRDSQSPAALPTAEGLLAAGDSAEMQHTYVEAPGSRLQARAGAGGSSALAEPRRSAAEAGTTPTSRQQRPSGVAAAAAPGRAGRSPSADGSRRGLGSTAAPRPSAAAAGAGAAEEQRLGGGSRGPAGGGGTPVGASPKAAGGPSGPGPARGAAPRRPGDARPPEASDRESLARLLQDSGRLTPALLPSSPAQFLQASRPPEQPLLRHLCGLWLEAGLGEREWKQGLKEFEGELADQPRQSSKLPGGGVDAEAQDHRLSLETFSMWLLKRGIRLRACPQWFRAFDFDQDEKIGVADFLQGLVAAAAPQPLDAGGAGGLCCSLALFRLLDLEKRQQGIDTRDLEAILADARVSLGGPDLALPIAQVARQATDFEFFRSFLLPRLQGAAAFRLRVFAELPPQES